MSIIIKGFESRIQELTNIEKSMMEGDKEIAELEAMEPWTTFTIEEVLPILKESRGLRGKTLSLGRGVVSSVQLLHEGLLLAMQEIVSKVENGESPDAWGRWVGKLLHTGIFEDTSNKE